MLNGIVPDCGILKLNQNRNTRKLDTLTPAPLDATSQSMKTKQKASLSHAGVILFNSLPTSIRRIRDDLNYFEAELDCLLTLLPDEPEVPGLVPRANNIYGIPSNDMIDWIRITDITNDFPSIVDDDD